MAKGNTACRVRGFSLNVEGAAQPNYEVHTSNDIQDPQLEPRVIPIV